MHYARSEQKLPRTGRQDTFTEQLSHILESRDHPLALR